MTQILLVTISAGISGSVYDSQSRAPLAAHVLVVELEHLSVCDTLGEFVIENMPQGEYELIASHVGYEDKILQVLVQDTDMTRLDIALNMMPIPMEQTETTTERYTLAPGRRIFEQKEMNAMPGAERNVFRAIQIMPGVSAASDYLGLFYVRGGELYENRVLLDNIEIMVPYHYFGVGSTFNADLIEDFEFLTGAMPARYGDAISSLLLLNTIETPALPNASVSVDLIEANVTYDQAFSGNLSTVFAAKRNYLDIILRQMDVVESVLLPYFFDVQGKVTAETRFGDVSLGGLYSKDGTDIQMTIADESIDIAMTGQANTAWLTWGLQTSERMRCEVYATYNQFRRNVQGTGIYSTDTVTEDHNVSKYGSQIHAEYDGNVLDLAAGAGFGHFRLDHSGAKIEDIFYKIGAIYYSLDADTGDYYGFLYAEQRFPLLRAFECEIGERLDWYPVIPEPVFCPRFKLIYRSNPNIYCAYDFQSQSPPLEYPVDEYKPLLARSANLGFEYLIMPALSWKIELYRKTYSNLIRAYDDSTLDNDGTGHATGIELSLRKYRIGNTYGIFSYSYSTSERTTPYDSSIVISDVHRPHALNLFFGSELPRGFQIGLQLQIASGLAYRPVIGAEGYWLPVYALEKERLPYYQRMDVHIGKQFKLWGVRGEFYVSVLNVTNRRNIQGYLYNWDYTLRKAIYMLPRIPMVGIRMEF
jgi:hypothetical protein